MLSHIDYSGEVEFINDHDALKPQDPSTSAVDINWVERKRGEEEEGEEGRERENKNKLFSVADLKVMRLEESARNKQRESRT